VRDDGRGRSPARRMGVDGMKLHGMSRATLNEALTGYLFILPWLLGFVVFVFGPLLAGLYYSFTDYAIGSPPVWIGIENYLTVTRDALVGKSLFNTFYYAAIAVPIGIMASLAVAMLLNSGIRGLSVYRTACYIPSIVPTIASVALMMWILHGRFGLINQLLEMVGIIGPGWLTDPKWTKVSLIIWALWTSGGTTMVILLAGLQGIPAGLYEVAEIDGANPWNKFRFVTVPMLSPTIFFCLVMAVIGSFQIFAPALILGSLSADTYWVPSGGPLDSLLFMVLYVYQNGFYFFKMGYASALAWVLFVIVMILTLMQFLLARRWVYYEYEAL